MFKYVWLFPVLMFTVIPLTFVITYIIAVYNKHVVPLFPYISDTGALPPESCIFGQLLNIGALLGVITVYLRHRQIVEFYKYSRQTKSCLIKTSLVFLWIGYLSCLGMSLVANFQETSVIVVHLIGALMAFGFGLIYGYGQTVLTYMVDKVFVGIWMAHIRLIICIIGTVLFILMQANGFVSNSGSAIQPNDGTTAKPPYSIDNELYLNGTAYDWYLVSAFSEWGFALATVLFFLTFAAEFRKAVLLPPRMVLNIGPGDFPRDHYESRASTPEHGATPTMEQRKQHRKSNANVYPEIRIKPMQTVSLSRYPATQPRSGYRSNDELFDSNRYNYGTNDQTRQLPIVFKPIPAKRL